MFQTPLILRAITFILMQLIFINLVSGEDSTLYDNSTNYAAQWKSGRSKRSLENMPYVLNIRIKYKNEKLISLKWMKQDQYIANEFLPVIMSSDDGSLDVMKDVGEFVVYYDLEKCSSVVYFEKLNAWFGNIGLRFTISYLPNKFDENGNYPGVVGEPYIMKPKATPVHFHPLRHQMQMQGDVLRRFNDGLYGGRERRRHSDPGPSTKYQRYRRDETINTNASAIVHIRNRRRYPIVQYHYLETLIFVTSDVAEIFKESSKRDNYITWTVRYCIMRFVSVDMIFNKVQLRSAKFLINIAKIVIEDDSRKSFYVSSNGELQFTETVEKLNAYLSSRHNDYPRDSFDHVFMITSLPIKVDSTIVLGESVYNIDWYAERKTSRSYNTFPVTLVGHEPDYAVAVNQISRVLGIGTDAQAGAFDDLVQCSGIMQESDSRCHGCIKWTDISNEQFEEFFRRNRNRCFLINHPRSLRRSGPSVFTPPDKQCRCFGYDSYIIAANAKQPHAEVDKCTRRLQCMERDGDQSHIRSTVRPFDGTRCENRDKVCWGGVCVSHGRK